MTVSLGVTTMAAKVQKPSGGVSPLLIGQSLLSQLARSSVLPLESQIWSPVAEPKLASRWKSNAPRLWLRSRLSQPVMVMVSVIKAWPGIEIEPARALKEAALLPAGKPEKG